MFEMFKTYFVIEDIDYTKSGNEEVRGLTFAPVKTLEEVVEGLRRSLEWSKHHPACGCAERNEYRVYAVSPQYYDDSFCVLTRPWRNDNLEIFRFKPVFRNTETGEIFRTRDAALTDAYELYDFGDPTSVYGVHFPNEGLPYEVGIIGETQTPMFMPVEL